MMRKIKWEYICLTGICAAYLGLTVYHLRELPGEWYGDISIEHRAVTAILSGHWPWQFNLSAGPAYHYIVAAFALVLGAGYSTYKLASVVTGLAAILLTYLLGKEFAGVRVGLLSALAGTVSFWLILFARLGSSPQILSPVLSAGAVYFLLRYRRTRRWYDAALSMLFAGWGLFTYPSTFVIPVIILALIAWQLFITRDRASWWRALMISMAILLPFAIGFYFTVKANPAFTSGGYVTSKISQQQQLSEVALTFGDNMLKALGMFQIKGDHAFRTNVRDNPILDPLSGVLMDLGLVWVFLNRRNRARWGYVIAPFLFMLMPSAAPGIPAVEIPSASRSLGVAPFAFLLIGLGMDAVLAAIQSRAAARKKPQDEPILPRPATAGDGLPNRSIPLTGPRPRIQLTRRGRWISGIVISLALVGMAYFNVNHYFNSYAWQLPGHNQAWDLLIAQYIQTLPAQTTVKMTACCWEDSEQPSLQVVNYRLQNLQAQASLDIRAYAKSCQDLQAGKRYVLIFPPDEYSPLVKTFRACFPYSSQQMHYDALGQPAFYTLGIDLR